MNRLNTPWAALLLALPAAAAPGDVTRISEDELGNPGTRASLSVRGGVNHISADGRFVVFRSHATNLDPANTDTTPDIYVYDRDTDSLELVSRNGAVKGNNSSLDPSLSADGRFVAFYSQASNLHDDDNDVTPDIFVYDRDTSTLELVSRNGAGIKGNRWSRQPSLSADGRYVAFYSQASNLHDDDNDTTLDIFVYDRDTDTIELVSRNGAVKGNNSSVEPSLSADGRFVAFHSHATNLDSADTDTTADIYVYDRDTGDIELVSRNGAGIKGNSHSFEPSLSADGRFVAFRSQATNLDPADTDTLTDIYVYDRDTDSLELVSRNDGTKGNNSSVSPSISADGRYVAFRSGANNLLPGVGGTQVYLYDRELETLSLLSSAADGSPGNGSSFDPSLSPKADLVLFTSIAGNLDGAANGYNQVFVKETGIVTNQPPVANAGGPYSVNEGGAVTLDGGASADPDGDPLTYAWDLDNDGQFDDASGANPGYMAGSQLGAMTIALQVTDPDGLSDSATTTVTVLDIVPVINTFAGSLDPVPLGNAAEASGVLSCASGDLCTAQLDWSDSNTGPVVPPDGAFTTAHTYTGPGVYALQLTLSDDDGNSLSQGYQYVVVFDASSSFVTGGGHIQVPVGAMPAKPELGGRASFGLVAKYQKGKQLPQGNTEFQFQVGGLHFRSVAYDWLVVAGAQAKYKGTGQINGDGYYGFMVSATDGDRLGNGIDKFRIKIWDINNNDTVVFDNELGAGDDAAPTTSLSGGQIVIHEKKGKK